MQTAIADDDFRGLAEQVDGLLALMAGALRTANHPHHLARASLGINQYGWTEAPYNDEAQRLWDKLNSQDADDIEALHHLAIVHHARAFDQECGPSAESANADWEAALHYWHMLCRQPRFWERLTRGLEGTKQRAALVETIKADFQEQLLQIHFDIAFDPDTTKLHRANYHLRLALDSPFPVDIKERVRQRTYERCLQGVDAQVWDKDILDPEIIGTGTQAIDLYLKRDAGCVVALCDMVRLQTRLANAWLQQWHAAGQDEHVRAPIERRFAEAIRQWQPYLDGLLEKVEGIEEDAREKLCRWYKNAAAVHRHWQEKYPEAIDFYKAALKAAADEGERRQIAVEIAETKAEQALSHAQSTRQQERDRARALAAKVLQLPEINVGVCLTLAQTFGQLGDLEQLFKVCETGLGMETDTLDINEIEKAEQGREHLRHFRDAAKQRMQFDALMEQATDAMEKEQFEQAIAPLNQAQSINGDNPNIYFLRCQCYLALQKVKPAQADLAKFRRLAEAEGDKNGIHLANQLQNSVRILEQHIRIEQEYGGVKAFALQQQAVEAFNKDRYMEAVNLLRQAISVAEQPDGDAGVIVNPSFGQSPFHWTANLSSTYGYQQKSKLPASAPAKLKTELSQALAAAAVAKCNSSTSQATMKEGRAMFEEALQFDPKNEQARTNLDILKNMGF